MRSGTATPTRVKKKPASSPMCIMRNLNLNLSVRIKIRRPWGPGFDPGPWRGRVKGQVSIPARVAEHSTGVFCWSCWLHEAEVPGLHGCERWPYSILTVNFVFRVISDRCRYSPNKRLDFAFIDGSCSKMNSLDHDHIILLLFSLNNICHYVLCLVSYLCCWVYIY